MRNNIIAPQAFVFDPASFESLLSFGLPFLTLPATGEESLKPQTASTLVIQLAHIKLIEIASDGQMQIVFVDDPEPLNLTAEQSQFLAEKIQKISDGLRSKIVGFPAQAGNHRFQ